METFINFFINLGLILFCIISGLFIYGAIALFVKRLLKYS